MNRVVIACSPVSALAWPLSCDPHTRIFHEKDLTMTMLRPAVFSLSPLSQQFDEMFKSMFAPTGRVASRSFPPLNAWEDEKNVIAEAELPGFKMEDLEITMTGRELTIRGKRTIERPEGASPLMSER